MAQTSLEFVVDSEKLDEIRFAFEPYRMGALEVTRLKEDPTKKVLTMSTNNPVELQTLAESRFGLHARVFQS